MYVTLSSVLHGAARRWPDKLAYVYAGACHTWLEVNRRVDALAASLIGLGVRPGDVIASCTKDGPVLNELVYAAARIGAIRVGVNYRMAPVEVRRLLEHCGAKVVFVQDEFSALIPDDLGLRVLSTGDAQTETSEYGQLIADGAGVAFKERWHDVAQYCYTTGTIGRPKAAIWTHEAIASAIGHTLLDLDFRRDDVWLHCFPGAGVPCLLAIWNVFKGFPTVVMPAFEAAHALDLMHAHRVTRVLFVPTMMSACCEVQQRQARDLSSVRCISYGSAPTSPALIRRAAEAFRSASFEGTYGSTEGVGGWFTTLTPDDHKRALKDRPHILESCGKPLHHVLLRVMRDDGALCEPGEVGEVAVQGSFLMKGYLHEPELTAKTLRDGWLMTGDMGRIDEEGYLYLVDRKQFMIITGGYNVYPIEVENALAAHPAVLEVCVFGVPDPHWGETVHASVVLRDNATVSKDELHGWARARLAKFKVPKSIEFREGLTRGATGKILKRAERDRYLATKA
jgi:acyl-CoA synthetase (AMP-forming)/AMP-acid ligase II